MKDRFHVLILTVTSLVTRFLFVMYYWPKLLPGSDENIYVSAAMQFLQWFLRGRLVLTSGLQYNYEHPQFAKILFALGIYFATGHLGSYMASRFIAAIIGTVGVVASYLLGKELFRQNHLAFALAFSFSFSFSYFTNTTLALLDGIAAAFIAISLLFLLRVSPSKPFDQDLALAGLFMGLAFASKLLAITGILVTFAYVLLLLKTKLVRKLLMLLLFCVIIGVVFIVVQPRMWFDPATRLYETLSFNARHISNGHPIPVSMLIGGNNSWTGPIILHPPWWTFSYWAIITVSPFQFFGIFLAILTVTKLSRELKFASLALLIPVTYLVLEGIYLPQYLTFLSLSASLIAITGYSQTNILTGKGIMFLSATTILAPVEDVLWHAGVDLTFTPIWLQLLQWVAFAVILGAGGWVGWCAHTRKTTNQNLTF